MTPFVRKELYGQQGFSYFDQEIEGKACYSGRAISCGRLFRTRNMPLVEHSKLPAFAQLRAQGHEVLSLDRAEHQDIRELHIGFLNMMPDAALQATVRQFIRLVGGCNRIAQFFV